MEEIVKFVGQLGGITIIVSSLSALLSKLFIDRYMESQKSKFQKVIEKYKVDLDLNKQILARYTNTQFEHYSKLWYSLYELKIMSDKLWEEATNDNFITYSNQLKKTKEEVGKSAIFIEDDDYEQLTSLLKKFLDYQNGKQKLMELRKGIKIEQFQVNQFIIENGNNKQNFEELISKIKKDLRSQIRGY